MKLTSKFLLILMFTIFATLECSNINKMFTKLRTKSINRGDIIKHFKTNYDPMLELHNSFFDRCLDHLSNQEILKNDSFFMKSVDNVKDLFSKGIIYEPLQIKELGITVKCENYLNEIVSESYIERKKQELKNLKTNLFNTNQNRIPKGRKESEKSKEKSNNSAPTSKTSSNTSIQITGNNISLADLEKQLRSQNLSEENITKILAQYKAAKNGGSSSSSSQSSSSTNGGSSLSQSSSTNGSSSSSTQRSTSSTTTYSYDSNGNLLINGKINGNSNGNNNGGSSLSQSSSSTTSYSYDSNGNLITNGGSNNGNSDRSTSYSGSTISGMGAKFSIFYDRKITQKDGKSYVEIGGVPHLIDEDGFIHGLNIDSSDKNINYNIAYENYFDTNCESMLEFMKNKYKQLLADYNMNKDYVHNLQIENRRYIVKVDNLTKENTSTKLQLNSCEQKIQDERVKKSTLYHNIKDLKTIKVNSRVKEMEETIIKLETTINNYKIEITNLKQIIKVNIDKCAKDNKLCLDNSDQKCKIEITKITNQCQKEKEELNQTIINLRITIKKLEIQVDKCKNQISTCEKDEIYIKWKKCESDYFKQTKEVIKIRLDLSTCQKGLIDCNSKVTKQTTTINNINIDISNCKRDLKICTDDDCKQKCTNQITVIKETYEKRIKEYITTTEKCDKDANEYTDCRSKLSKCESDSLIIQNKLEIQCEKDKTELKNKCEEEKNDYKKQLQVKIETIRKLEVTINTCNDQKSICDSKYSKCSNSLTSIISEKDTECSDKIAKEKSNCDSLVNIQIINLKQCKDEKDKIEEEQKKQCDESTKIINENITNITIKFDKCTQDNTTNEQDITKYKNLYELYLQKFNNCTADNNNCGNILQKCKEDKTLNCNNYYVNINNQLTQCQTEKKKINLDYTTLQTSYLKLEISLKDCNKKLDAKDGECSTKIASLTVSIKKEESTSCESRITIINQSIQTTINNYSECQKKKDICDKELIDYTDYKKYKTMYLTCQTDLTDRDTKITNLNYTITQNTSTIKEINITISTCNTDLGKCRNTLLTNNLQTDLNTCTAKVKNLENLIQRFDLVITQLQSSFNLTINEMTTFYQSKIVKLQNIISSLKDNSSSSTSTVTTITVTVTKNTDEIDRNTREINILRDKIKILIEQKKELLNKLDTVDCSSITIITEHKTRIVQIQDSIEDYYNQIIKYEGFIRIYSEENSRLKAQIEMYKSNEEFYQELITKYSEVVSDQSEYIKRLEKLLEQYKIKDKDGSVIDISIYINNNNNDQIITQLKNQITQINVTIKNLTIQYNNSLTTIKEEFRKSKEECNNQLNIYINYKSESEERCQTKIDNTRKQITEKYEVYFNSIRIKFGEQLNECKKNCKSNNSLSLDNSTEYDFDLYKKHCLTLIDRNTSQDCRAINEVRTYYNEKCIMTSLPTSSVKDLTTFASSDFTDDRNSLMMKRLNTVK